MKVVGSIPNESKKNIYILFYFFPFFFDSFHHLMIFEFKKYFFKLT